jgi:PAS domain S-box-containing protein
MFTQKCYGITNVCIHLLYAWEQRAKDAELVDFFQNAPIALHWLSGEGIILWANQTELDVLQYTAEEYIGQPVMKFCPDEQDLVLEIFKTLGSGNIIKDVPVRFRRKDGVIVPLLIDSNVNYTAEGTFNHTRCFIRDDTGRKVREARAEALTDEMARSLKLLDNFMSNTLHFVRTPCNVMSHALEEARDRLDEVYCPDNPETAQDAKTASAIQEGLMMIDATVRELTELTSTLDDVSDLQRFEQGAEVGLYRLNAVDP